MEFVEPDSSHRKILVSFCVSRVAGGPESRENKRPFWHHESSSACETASFARIFMKNRDPLRWRNRRRLWSRRSTDVWQVCFLNRKEALLSGLRRSFLVSRSWFSASPPTCSCLNSIYGDRLFWNNRSKYRTLSPLWSKPFDLILNADRKVHSFLLLWKWSIND